MYHRHCDSLVQFHVCLKSSHGFTILEAHSRGGNSSRAALISLAAAELSGFDDLCFLQVQQIDRVMEVVEETLKGAPSFLLCPI